MKASDIPGGPKRGEILCRLSEIEDGMAREFSYRHGDEMRDIFIHRMGDEIYSYENSCPHAFIPLNMDQGHFIDKTGAYFICQNHGALFDIKNGLCVAGPCNGQSLTIIDVELKEGNIIAL